MKNKIYAAVVIAMLSLSAAAQLNLGTIKGKCTDEQGQPITDGHVILQDNDTGRKYDLKTNNKGEYMSIAVQPGTYKVTLTRAGKEVFSLNNVRVTLSEDRVADFDLKKERATAAPGQMSEAQKKAQEATVKENATVKDLNNMLAQTRAAQASGDFDTAVAVMTKATQVDPNRDLLWYTLGDSYLGLAKKQTTPDAKKEDFVLAANNYKKAIDLAAASADPKAKERLGSYNNNYGKALEGSRQVEEAAKAFQAAAIADPANAGNYYFNMGGVLTNANRSDEAIAAFDKAIAADPNKADAYYWKGIALIGKATVKDNKTVAPAGTAEAFNRYLELQPDGPNAEGAKAMLATIGAKVETSYKAAKKTPEKKK